VRKFYNNYEKLSSVLSTTSGLVKEYKVKEAMGLLKREELELEIKPSMDLVYNALSNANEFVQTVYNNPGISAKDKRQLIDNTYLQMITLAKESNKIFEKDTK
jgi:hypothetical protein